MNIFALDDNPFIAARMLCDKHIVKMAIESAQMLSTAHRVLDGFVYTEETGRKIKRWKHEDENLYKAVHVNHPCSLWCRETSHNYMWLLNHWMEICNEYTFRYEKTHATETKLFNSLAKFPRNIRYADRTPFALAMKSNLECIIPGEDVLSYQNYYLTKKDRFKMNWTKRKAPEFFKTKVDKQ